MTDASDKDATAGQSLISPDPGGGLEVGRNGRQLAAEPD
jgi:hypothetical protein